jgi:DNA-directed RNA polymerase specialized sigma24 family protein
MLHFGVPAADVEDAAHDVFLLSCRRRIDLSGSEDRHGWLYLTARYVGLNRRRSLRREAARRSFSADEAALEREDRTSAPDEQLAAQQLCRLLAAGLEQLSDAQRSAVSCLLEGCSATDIAVEQRAPVATVASRVRVSRLALRRHLQRSGWPVPPALPDARRAA